MNNQVIGMFRHFYVWLTLFALGGTAISVAWWLKGHSPEAPAKDESANKTIEPAATARTPLKPEPELPAGVDLQFVDVTEKAEIKFMHFDGHTDREYIMETLGPGLGWIDYDQDGLMDLFLVQGAT